MQTKHFVNDPKLLVESALRSLCIVQPELSLDIANKVIYAPTQQDNVKRVSIVSGGGAGHEPSFSGFVGEGVLSAAVSGSIFASPSSQQVLSAIENVDASQGVLVTVMNYTGDVLNFGVAVEKARARNPELRIEMLVVGDDVAVTRSKAGKVGRRGIAGTVLVHKITGAMAAAGYGLDDVVRVGRLVAENVASVGVSLGRVHVPGRPVEDVSENELGMEDIELGMGIHNEAGCGRRSGRDAELPVVVSEMLDQILGRNDVDRRYFPRHVGDKVLLVNNLGALSVLELGAVVTEVVEQLSTKHHIKCVRVYAGTYMTSLDGPGFSISLMNVVETGVDKGILQLLDAPSNVRGWHSLAVGSQSTKSHTKVSHTNGSTDECQDQQKDYLICDMELLRTRLEAGLQAMISSEPEVTKYDDLVGDGDCGTTLKRGAEAIMDQVNKKEPKGLVSLLSIVASAIEISMDGTSGALYSIFFNSLLHHVKLSSQDNIRVDAHFWSAALSAAVSSLIKYTPAQIGDRTMMDALIPFVDSLEKTQSLQAASAAARDGAEKTKSMRPGLGRSVYVGNEASWLGKIPDPGAWGLNKFFEGIART